MVNIEDCALNEDGIEDVEDLLHGSGIVLVTTMELGEGIHDHKGRLHVAHNLDKIGRVVRVVHDVQGWTDTGRGEDHEIAS